jgi:hypothetical protein
MNKVTVAEAKRYLGLDGNEQDALLSVFIEAATHTVEKVMRKPITEETPDICKAAVLYAVWQFYFHRDDAEFKANEMEKTIAVMLSDLRKKEF